MSLIGKRYAEALIEIASKNAALDQMKKELLWLKNLFTDQRGLISLISDPNIAGITKKQILKDIFTESIDKNLVDFLMLLIDKGRIKDLDEIYREFEDMANKDQRILNMKIISAYPLNDKQIDRIKENYTKKLGYKSASAEFFIDKSIIGGIKIIIGDKVIDSSLKGKLDSLKESIIKT